MRRDFPRKVKAAAIARAAGHCERCKAVLKPREGEVDHVLPDILGGEPVLANAMVLCRACHAPKTADDIRRTRKADRQRDKSTGAVRPTGKLANRGFPKSQKPKPPSKPMPVRVRDVFGRPIARTAT
jgi:5-methylcytosine-specific restriction protein A